VLKDPHFKTFRISELMLTTVSKYCQCTIAKHSFVVDTRCTRMRFASQRECSMQSKILFFVPWKKLAMEMYTCSPKKYSKNVLTIARHSIHLYTHRLATNPWLAISERCWIRKKWRCRTNFFPGIPAFSFGFSTSCIKYCITPAAAVLDVQVVSLSTFLKVF
jgi:hypothetical protein